MPTRNFRVRDTFDATRMETSGSQVSTTWIPRSRRRFFSFAVSVRAWPLMKAIFPS